MWKSIPEFSDYEVSDQGSIRRVSYSDKRGPRNKLPYYPRLSRNRAGYLRCGMRRDDGRNVIKLTHQAVAAAFHGPKPNWATAVCHKDGNKLNNTPENLYYGTHKDNGKDCIRHGVFEGRYKQDNHPTQKLTVEQVREIKRRLDGPESRKTIANDFDVAPTTITMIATGRNWAWVK